MSTKRTDDEITLIDLLMGELPDQARLAVERRLDRDESFCRLKRDIEHTFQAADLLPAPAPPADLLAGTVAAIARARRTEALIAKERLRRSPARPSFSLRELAVAAAAVIIMAIALIPSVRQAKNLAVAAQCGSNVGQIGAGLLAYANTNDDYLPAADGRRDWWLANGQAATFSNSAVLYKLVRQGYVSPPAFRCPAGGRGMFRTEAGMTDFPSEQFISYSYQNTLGPHPLRGSDPKLLAVADRMAILADSTPVFSNGRFFRDRLARPTSDNHHRRGQNVLYLDMHVKWTRRPDVGVGNDNIFLVEGVSDYRGNERPAGATDTFLLPAFTPTSPSSPAR